MIVSRKVRERIDAGDWAGARLLMPKDKPRKGIARKSWLTQKPATRRDVCATDTKTSLPHSRRQVGETASVAGGTAGATPRIRSKKRRTAAQEREREQRIYGTPEHRAWLHAQACVISRRTGNRHDPIVAAHTKGDAGTGYKASARFQVPMLYTLHCELHQNGPETFERKYRVTLVGLAAKCWADWCARCEALGVAACK